MKKIPIPEGLFDLPFLIMCRGEDCLLDGLSQVAKHRLISDEFSATNDALTIAQEPTLLWPPTDYLEP